MTADTDGVVPQLRELIALRATAQRRGPARHGRHGASGPAASQLRGRGMEYAESREYVAGDDVRHIDWRLTARSGRTHTKLFQAERERLSLIVADTSASLYFGTRVRFKSTQAARAGAVAVWNAIRDGDRVAAVRGSRLEPPVPPASGPRGALRVLDALVRWYAQAPADDQGLASALEAAGRLLRPGSRLIVLADPASVASLPQEVWTRLSAHHDVVVLLLFDVLEETPPEAALAFQSAQHRIELDLADSAQRARWQHVFAEPITQALAQLPGRGVRVQSLRADAPSDAWLPLLGRPQPQVA
ncbi:DUF58 domain-containing protein [Pseudoxanthomonas indica]|uniref:DUF58 domain-containing protein n=1 Tax=Pseudoxanthomonas indica TaxID=428993 RepID=A0A1T5JTK3_9GAMM|nr:DUF58 domain-containing protein [Pseudoxanthomonas indica]GGD44315.1 ATPase [Pseudoxanthomonas indica]SKC54746.1 Protein of unknown function DUF58 [Pseudoxanthomonas indica]